MCGIVAQAGKSTLRFFTAFDRIKHRGVRHRIKESKGGRIAHVRLPIVGVGEENDQPVREGNWTIAFVGEVLDFRDSDSHLPCDLPIAVNEWADMSQHDGFWHIVALHDNGDLYVVCDYLAQKPAYYRPDVRAVASEPDALIALERVTLDEVYLSAVLKWGYCPELDRTPYREIKHVLPGEMVCLAANGQVIRQIVDPLRPRGSVNDLKDEIERAVHRRVLASDVAIAALLSGGLDSSITCTLASRHGDVRPYYVDLGDGDTEERLAVSAVCSKTTELFVKDINEDFRLEYLQEPIDLGSATPQIALARAIPETVCLTGDGADEAFGGYGRAMKYDSQYSDLFHELPAWHLPRLDRVMMRHQIEVRSPFLSRRVVEIALTLPWELRQDKKILRQLFWNDLPPGIASRPKKPLRMTVDRQALVEQFRGRII